MNNNLITKSITLTLALLMILSLSILTPTTLAQEESVTTTKIYGGEKKTLYEYDQSFECKTTLVNVKSSLPIEFTPQNIREYDIEQYNCNYTNSTNTHEDNWLCECDESGEYDLILSVLPNTINNYSFLINFENKTQTIIIGGNENETQNETDDDNEPVSESVSYSTYSSGAGKCVTEWTCTEWSECLNGYQRRTCTYPENYCEPEDEMPNTTRTCINEEPTNNNMTRQDDSIYDLRDNNYDNLTNITSPNQQGVTGLVTGAQYDEINWFALISLILLGSIIFLIVKRKNKK